MRFSKTTLAILASAALAPILAGCCSDSGTVTTVNPTKLNGAANLEVGPGKAAVVVPATGGAPVTVVVNGVDTPAVVPSGVPNIPANIPAGTLYGLILLGSSPGTGDYTAGSNVQAGDSDDPDVLPNVVTGVTVNATGATNQTLAFPLTEDPAGINYSIGFPQGNVRTRDLTIKRFFFSGRWYVNRAANGNRQIVSPVPILLAGTLPNNGENAAGHSMLVTWGPGNNGRNATLRVVYGNGFVLQQTKTIIGSTATFSNIDTDASNVPAGGVNLVAFRVGPRP
jgi:hypothetical protein